MKKYLITGGLGFIGTNLSNFLSHKNKIIIIDDKSNSSNKKILNKKNIQIKICKLQNVKKLNNIRGVFHLCAQSSAQKSLEDVSKSSVNNILSSIKAFEIAKHNKCPIIFASSSAVYGNIKIGNDKLNNTDLLSPYALDKYYLEKLSKIFFKIHQVSSIGMRLYNVYGPGQKGQSKYSGVISKFNSNFNKNKKTIIFGGKQTRDFIHVNDVVKLSILLMKIARQKKINEIFNIGTGKQISIMQLYKKIKDLKNKENKLIIQKPKLGDPKISKGTFSKINKYLKNNYEFISLDEGLRKLI